MKRVGERNWKEGIRNDIKEGGVWDGFEWQKGGGGYKPVTWTRMLQLSVPEPLDKSTRYCLLFMRG